MTGPSRYATGAKSGKNSPLRASAVRLALFVLLTALTLAARSGADTPAQRARAILHERAYDFCTDRTRFTRPGEARFCGYVDRNSACPAFAEACDRVRPNFSCGAPAAIGALSRYARIVVIGVLVFAAVAVLWLIARGVLRARKLEAVTASRVLMDTAPVPVHETALPANELWRMSADAHARGAHERALYLLHAAALKRLDERGSIRLDPASTHGDYLRQLNDDPARPAVREMVRDVERVRFGGAGARPEAFERHRASIARVLLFAVALLAGLSLVACDAERAGGPADTSIDGHAAVRRLLTSFGTRTRRLAEAPEDVRDPMRVIVLDGEAVALDAEQWSAVLEWVAHGGRLVLAGGGSAWPPTLGVTAAAPGHAGREVALDPAVGTAHARLMAPARQLSDASVVRARIVARFVDDEAPYAAVIEHGAGRVLLLATGELLTNGGIAVGTNADLPVQMIESFAGDRDVYFVEDASGSAGNPLAALARVGLLAAVLQILLGTALYGLMIGRHFATPRDRDLRTRRAFSEHVRAIGALYARAHATRAVARAYARFVTDRLRERTGTVGAGLVDAVASRVGEPRDEVERVLHTAEDLQANVVLATDEAGDLRLVKRLNDWWTRLH